VLTGKGCLMNQENKENAKAHQTQINDSETANVVDNTSATNQSAQGTGNNLSINNNTYNSKYNQTKANIAGIVDTAESGSTVNITQNNYPTLREPIKPANKIPHQGTPHFVGRDNELAIIHEKFTEQNNTVAISAVAGMGGVGKTELAVKYAREHIDDYPGGVCWFSVRSSNIATEILTFAKNYLQLEVPQKDFQEQSLTLQQQVEWCWENWQPPDGVVLIVFDDVTDLENFADYLPKNNRFRVLITTRLREIDANIEEISLDVLSADEALRLFTNIVGDKKANKELEIAKEICKWLGYLPLGIELVGRYIAKKPPHFTLAKMLEQLKQQRLEQEGINPQQKTLSTAQLGVKAAFELSWLELNEQTQKLAALLSLFAAEIFAWEWVESITGSLNWDEDDVNKAIEELYQRHLVNSLEESDIFYYKTHTLIREFLQ
jgi:NB-ARC domain